MNDIELLRHIYRCIDFQRLARSAPDAGRDNVIVLFQKLSKLIEQSEPSYQTEDTEIKRGQVLIINVDGASRGNPGKSAVGVAVYDNNENLLCCFGQYVGEGTSNEAEYKALTLAAEWAHERGAGAVTFRTDSELLHNQITGVYRVKAAHLRRLAVQAHHALAKLPSWSIETIPREANFDPDSAANAALDKMGKRKKRSSKSKKAASADEANAEQPEGGMKDED